MFPGLQRPFLSLAPMQDVSGLAFWKVMAARGGPDVYVTEYFRVHPTYFPEKKILASINQSGVKKPILAQLIGNEPFHLGRTARLIQDQSQCAGIDLNLGCPSPRVCGHAAGGALLKNHDLIRRIIESLRPVVSGTLTIKTRVGFDSAAEFDQLLTLFAALPIDGLAIHGRTVKDRYQSDVNTGKIRQAASTLTIPISANGSIVNVPTALAMIKKTGAAGLMIGRGAIRNPWLFDQIRCAISGAAPLVPTLTDQLHYVEDLYEELARSTARFDELRHVQRLKKFMNYIASGVGDGEFSSEIRRVRFAMEFWKVCRSHLSGHEPLPPMPGPNDKLFCGYPALAALDSCRDVSARIGNSS